MCKILDRWARSLGSHTTAQDINPEYLLQVTPGAAARVGRSRRPRRSIRYCSCQGIMTVTAGGQPVAALASWWITLRLAALLRALRSAVAGLAKEEVCADLARDGRAACAVPFMTRHKRMEQVIPSGKRTGDGCDSTCTNSLTVGVSWLSRRRRQQTASAVGAESVSAEAIARSTRTDACPLREKLRGASRGSGCGTDTGRAA